MRAQDYIVGLTEWAVANLFCNARAVPEDRREWKPMDAGRSVMSMVRECAHVPTIFTTILETRSFPPMDPEAQAKEIEEQEAWTLDECERRCHENTARLLAVIREFPDEDMAVSVTLPFGEGVTVTLGQVMGFHYDNTTYHVGQIAYIQTLLGDEEMHLPG